MIRKAVKLARLGLLVLLTLGAVGTIALWVLSYWPNAIRSVLPWTRFGLATVLSDGYDEPVVTVWAWRGQLTLSCLSPPLPSQPAASKNMPFLGISFSHRTHLVPDNPPPEMYFVSPLWIAYSRKTRPVRDDPLPEMYFVSPTPESYRPMVERRWNVAIWLVLGIFAVYPTIVFIRSIGRRRRYRKKHGLCVRCGYDLTGNLSGVCPECGTEIKQP